jgi:hypothetical protein
MLAHIVNPVSVGPASDLFLAQPITFETMRRARAFAHTNEGIRVDLFTAQYAEDCTEIPGFKATPNLERSVMDFGAFTVERKLPLIADVFARLYDASKADYFIFTNVDIALKPEFYVSVAKLIERGVDAAVINRRTVTAGAEQARDLDWLYRQAGEKQPGWDCFLFRNSLLAGFDFHALCIGALPVGQVLLAVLSTLAQRFELLEDAGLTFHLNDDQAWANPLHDQFHRHNFQQAHKILRSLEARGCGLSSFAARLDRRVRAQLDGR